MPSSISRPHWSIRFYVTILLHQPRTLYKPLLEVTIPLHRFICITDYRYFLFNLSIKFISKKAISFRFYMILVWPLLSYLLFEDDRLIMGNYHRDLDNSF